MFQLMRRKVGTLGFWMNTFPLLVMLAIAAVWVGKPIVANSVDRAQEWVSAVVKPAPVFVPDSWSGDNPAPFPLLGAVDVSTSVNQGVINDGITPVEFDVENALERPTWKIVVINQYGVSAWANDKLLRWMADLKTAIVSTDTAVETWFLRANRPSLTDIWADGRMVSECGPDGSACFDEYLLFAESSLDYSLEKAYLGSIAPACGRVETSPVVSVMVVDPEGRHRQTYSDCTKGTTLQSLLLNLEHHAGVTVDTSYTTGMQVGLPAERLSPSVEEQLAIKGRSLIRQVGSRIAVEAEAFDQAVSQWRQ